MITLFDFQEILDHKELWENEQEHKYIIKRVEVAKNHNLPKSILDEVFPYGQKSKRLNALKSILENDVLLKYPTPVPIAPLESLTTQELREYITLLNDALLNQYRMTTESIYKISPDNADYSMVMTEFLKKLSKNSRMEVGFAIILLLWIVATVLGSLMVPRDNIEYWLVIAVLALIAFFGVVMFVGITRPKYFTIDNKYKPEI